MEEFQSQKLEDQAMQDEILSRYLPAQKAKRPLPRQYLYNIINSIKPDFFPHNIQHAMKRRSEYGAMQPEEKIVIKQEFMSFFSTRTFISSSKKGRAAAMMKPAKALEEAEKRLNDRLKNERRQRTMEKKKKNTLFMRMAMFPASKSKKRTYQQITGYNDEEEKQPGLDNYGTKKMGSSNIANNNNSAGISNNAQA